MLFTHLAARKSRTEQVNLVLKQFKQLIRTKEATIRAAFENDPSVVTEFFPRGLSEYSTATVGNAGILMERMVSAITARAASLPTGFVTPFNDLKTQFTAARSEQQDEKGHVTNVRAMSSAERISLCKQLYKNLCNIMALCVANPAEGSALFDESLLWGRRGKKEEEPAPAQ